MKLLLFYTDPGSGMMLLQIILASVAGVFYFFRNSLLRLIGRGDRTQPETEKAAADAADLDRP